MSSRAEYELVPNTDDPTAPQPVHKGRESLLRSRRTKLAVLSVVVVVLLTVVYRFWFRDTAADTGHLPDESKEGASITLSSTSTTSITQPTQKPPEGDDKGGEETMPAGKYSVG